MSFLDDFSEAQPFEIRCAPRSDSEDDGSDATRSPSVSRQSKQSPVAAERRSSKLLSNSSFTDSEDEAFNHEAPRSNSKEASLSNWSRQMQILHRFHLLSDIRRDILSGETRRSFEKIHSDPEIHAKLKRWESEEYNGTGKSGISDLGAVPSAKQRRQLYAQEHKHQYHGFSLQDSDDSLNGGVERVCKTSQKWAPSESDLEEEEQDDITEDTQVLI